MSRRFHCIFSGVTILSLAIIQIVFDRSLLADTFIAEETTENRAAEKAGSVRSVENDWPMWRCDAERSAASSHPLPDSLRVQWKRSYPARKQAWDDPLNLDLMTYDQVLEPIVIDGRMVIGFNDTDQVQAIDVNTGKLLWTFYTEAPVRLPPAGLDGRVYFCSDDGYLYCVQVSDGKLLWKFQGGPSLQHAIGNQRLTSAWPARGGPVIRDGKVYFAASIWPFMGTFLYSLDAESGKLDWVNDSTGAQYIKQPHSAPAFAGVAPQGALVATSTKLVVPGGRSVPAVFDRKDGSLLYFDINAGGKGTGGSFVTADEKYFYVHTREKGTRAFDLATGVKTAFMPNEPVHVNGVLYSAEKDTDGSHVVRAYGADQKVAWQLPVDGSGDLIVSGDKLLAAGSESITAVSIRKPDAPEILFSLPIVEPVKRLLSANGKLFTVSGDGIVTCYGEGEKPADLATLQPEVVPLRVRDESNAELDQALGETSAEGFAFWYGRADSDRVEAMANRSPFVQLAIIDPDAERVRALQEKLGGAQLYGRVTVHASDAISFRAPQYVASMVFLEAESKADLEPKRLERVYASVRPYGGAMVVLSKLNPAEIADSIRSVGMEQADVQERSYGVVVHRNGALPGSSDWTHQYGNIANTIKSDDRRVQLPLGILWFGGSSNMDVLPRHGHGPPEQVVGGRLFIQGIDSLSARDVYTGRVLWKRELPNLGTFDVYYDATYENTPLDPKYNQVHIPGANGRGTNFVATEDRVYILEGNVCHALDPVTGQTLLDIPMPALESGETTEWGYIGVYQDVLLGGMGFARYREKHQLTFEADKQLTATKAGFGSKSLDRAASGGLIAFDRHTGKPLWKVLPSHSFWHNGIVAGEGKFFCLDKVPTTIEEGLKRRGKTLPEYRIIALDHRTGALEWEVKEGVFGTWLGYSEQHGLLLQAGAQASDRLASETGQGMAVYRAHDGSLQWKNEKLKYAGPCILHNDWIITNTNAYSTSAGAFYLKTGKQKLVFNPLTGIEQPWTVTRSYGCNSIIASENLLTFRSGAAGFFDLKSDAGTGNLGGFKSGCTSNLVVANGVLNAPDYTRTCSCSYQNQTSLALVPMPDIDLWTVSSIAGVDKETPLQKLAINFGAPGDRRDQEGTLWMEYPAVAGEPPPIDIRTNPAAKPFLNHTTSMSGFDRPWLLSSGLENVTEVSIRTVIDKPYNLKTGLAVEHVEDDGTENKEGTVKLSGTDLNLAGAEGEWIGIRFNQIALAKGTKIRKAHIQFTCSAADLEGAKVRIQVENSANAKRFVEAAKDISSRPTMPQEILWDPKPWTTAKDSTAAQRTPDLSKLIEQIIQHPDWKPGNSIVFLLQGIEGKRSVLASKGASREAPLLVIDAESVSLVDVPPDRFDLKLHFAAPPYSKAPRVFDVFAQGKLVASRLRIDPNGGPESRYLVQEFRDIEIAEFLKLEFVPIEGEPIVNGLEIIRRSHQ